MDKKPSKKQAPSYNPDLNIPEKLKLMIEALYNRRVQLVEAGLTDSFVFSIGQKQFNLTKKKLEYA